MTTLMENLCRLRGVAFDHDRWVRSVEKRFHGRESEKGCALVADAKGVVIGMAFLSIKRQEAGFVYGWISNLVVDPGFRGRGVGEALVREALDYFRRSHVRNVRVTVKASSTGAPRLFVKLGFEEVLRVFEYKF